MNTKTKGKTPAKKAPGKKAKGKQTTGDEAEALPPKGEPTVLGVVPKGELKEIFVSEIDDPPDDNDRLSRPDDQQQIDELARSLREVGQLQPIMVESVGQLGSPVYQRVFGRRRLAAARQIGAKTILAIVVDPLSPDVRRTIVAVENIQRKDISPAEEHIAVADLMELQAFSAAIQIKQAVDAEGTDFHGTIVTAEALASNTAGRPIYQIKNLRKALLGDHRVRARACELVAAMLAKSPTWVRDRMYIGRLGDTGRRLVLDLKLPLAHAREIAKLQDPELREQLAEDFAAGGNDAISETEAGELAKLKEEVGRRVFSLKVVDWKLDAPIAGCRECLGCPHNSATNPGLFEHGGQLSEVMRGGVGDGHFDATPQDVDSICTDPKCYSIKLKATKAILSNVAKKVVDQQGSPGDVKNIQVVKPQAVNDRIKHRRLMKKQAPTIQRKSGPTPKQIKEQATREARYKLNQALEKRCKAIEPALAKLLAEKPGAWAMYVLIRSTKLYEATEHYDEKKCAKAAQNPVLKSLMRHILNPSLEGVIEIESHAGRFFGILNEWKDGKSGFIDVVAVAIGLKIPPAPKLEDFMPAVEAKPAADVKPQASKKKKIVRPKSKPAQVEASEDEEDEE